MRTCSVPVLLALGLLALVGPVRSEDEAKNDTIPYLGVATAPVDPMLARHLRIRPGTGLLVEMVDEKSAAGGALEREDILLELDGQLLINPEQFVTLVRLQKPGQEIALKLRRAGAEKTVKVKLGERPAPREEQVPMDDAWERMFRWPRELMSPGQAMPDRALRSPRGGSPGGELRLKRGPPGDVQVQMHTSSVIEQDGKRAELTYDGKTRHFKVTDAKGKVLFDGDVQGDTDVEKMAREVRDLYDQLSENTKVEIRHSDPKPAAGDPATRVDT